MMFDRRSILKMLGCAPCAPLAPKVHEYFDDWCYGEVIGVYPGWDGATQLRERPNLASLHIDMACGSFRCPTADDGHRLKITGPGIAANYQLYEIRVDSWTQFGVRKRRAHITVRGDGRHIKEMWDKKHVHFRVEAD